MVALFQRHDFAPPGVTTRRFDRDIVGLGTTGREHGVLQAGGSGEPLSQLSAGRIGEMMITHIGKLQRVAQYGQQLRVPMAETVGAAIEMEIHKLATVHIAEAVAIALADHQVDPQGGQPIDPVRKQVVAGALQYQGLCR